MQCLNANDFHFAPGPNESSGRWPTRFDRDDLAATSAPADQGFISYKLRDVEAFEADAAQPNPGRVTLPALLAQTHRPQAKRTRVISFTAETSRCLENVGLGATSTRNVETAKC